MNEELRATLEAVRSGALSVDEAALRAAIKDTGYEVKEVSSAPCEKKGLFGVFKR